MGKFNSRIFTMQMNSQRLGETLKRFHESRLLKTLRLAREKLVTRLLEWPFEPRQRPIIGAAERITIGNFVALC